MRILAPDDAGIQIALQALQAGDVLAHATETCYGLACDLSNPKAVAALFEIKNRAPDQPVSALFHSIEQAKKYVVWNEEAERLANEQLPGPLTIVLPLNPGAPHRLFPTPTGGESLGVRVSPHPVAWRLAREFGRPLSTTSANVSGRPNPYSTEDIAGQFAGRNDKPAMILDSGKLPETSPSTVIDLRSPESRVLRGSIPA